MTRLVVAPGGLITSTWGNATHDATQISFASAAQRSTDWPTPPDGALSWLADSHTPWIYRAGGWKPYPLGVLAVGTGPTAQTDYTAAADITGTSVTVPIVTGRRYRVTGYASGSIVTGTTAGAWVAFYESLGTHLPSGTRRLFQQFSIPLGMAVVGGASWAFTATVTANDTFNMKAFSNQPAYRIGPNECQIVIEDIGG